MCWRRRKIYMTASTQKLTQNSKTRSPILLSPRPTQQRTLGPNASMCHEYIQWGYGTRLSFQSVAGLIGQVICAVLVSQSVV